jgi:PPOX class probable F420-dependent enzyme
MANPELISFVRDHPWGVVSSLGPSGEPQAALVGIAVTDRGEVVFDSSPDARKVANLRRDPRAALVVIVQDEVTLQCEGTADLPTGTDRLQCFDAYLSVFPEGRDRAGDGTVLLRITPHWARIADFRPDSFGLRELDLS